MSARRGWQHKGGRGMKSLLPNMKRNQLGRFGGERPFALIATRVTIKEPRVGGSIQSSALRTKNECRNWLKQLFDKQVHHREMTH